MSSVVRTKNMYQYSRVHLWTYETAKIGYQSFFQNTPVQLELYFTFFLSSLITTNNKMTSLSYIYNAKLYGNAAGLQDVTTDA